MALDVSLFVREVTGAKGCGNGWGWIKKRTVTVGDGQNFHYRAAFQCKCATYYHYIKFLKWPKFEKLQGPLYKLVAPSRTSQFADVLSARDLEVLQYMACVIIIINALMH